MNKATLRRFAELKAGGLLPTPKGVALSILEATGRPDIHINEIVRRVQTDPATAGRLLRYANSAATGSQRHVASLQQAIALLGVFRVRQVALAFTLLDQYRHGVCPDFDYAGYWTTSLATGIAAQQLAGLAASPPDESFTCGLLSGIGRLALATAFPDDYGALLARHLDAAALRDEETAHFGIDHANLAAEMLAAWGLPGLFVDAVRDHENPADSPATPGSRAYALTAALHFAAQIGQLLHLDEAQRWDRVPALYDAAARAGMEQDDVPRLVRSVVDHWQRWAKELNLPTRDYPDLKELLASPPWSGSDVPPKATLLPMRVVLVIDAPERRRAWAAMLAGLGLGVGLVADLGDPAASVAGADLVIFDAGNGGPLALDRLRTLHRAAPAVYLLVLVDAVGEAAAEQLMPAGASDYLRDDALPVAVVTRLLNVQRVIALQGTLKAERELAVKSSHAWAKTNRRLIHDALTDVLTQLPNRRYGLDRLAQEWSVAQSNALPLACLMLDIDHFKSVNDRHGHDVGDRVLRQLASVVNETCRRSDVAFRYGGEEFCVICPATGAADARILAQRILDAVRASPFGHAAQPLRLTVSIGLAVRDVDVLDPQALIAAADRALYAAKANGRDQVVVATTG